MTTTLSKYVTDSTLLQVIKITFTRSKTYWLDIFLKNVPFEFSLTWVVFFGELFNLSIFINSCTKYL